MGATTSLFESAAVSGSVRFVSDIIGFFISIFVSFGMIASRRLGLRPERQAEFSSTVSFLDKHLLCKNCCFLCDSPSSFPRIASVL